MMRPRHYPCSDSHVSDSNVYPLINIDKCLLPTIRSIVGYGRVILVAVFLAVSSYRYLGDGGTDQREIFHDGTCVSQICLFPFWGRYSPGSPKSKNLKFWLSEKANISKTVSHSVTCQLMSIRA